MNPAAALPQYMDFGGNLAGKIAARYKAASLFDASPGTYKCCIISLSIESAS